MEAPTFLLESFNLEHLPQEYAVHVALYSPVNNSAFLHAQLLAGNAEFEYAFIDASIIVSRTHALAAVYRAINDSLESRLKSRNVHSEAVFCLSPSNNIAESFRRFGVTPTSTSMLAIKISTPEKPFSAEQVQRHLSEVVEGTQLPFTDNELWKGVDVAKVRKYYKLNSGGGGGSGGGGKKKQVVNGHAGAQEVDERKELEVQILGTMALRGAS